jgi:hypothetical protein
MSEPTVVNCTNGTCTLTISIAAAPASEDQIADMSALWGLFLLAAIVVFCVRKLSHIFESPPHGD